MSIIDVYLLFVWYGIKEYEEGYVYIFEIYVLKKCGLVKYYCEEFLIFEFIDFVEVVRDGCWLWCGKY